MIKLIAKRTTTARWLSLILPIIWLFSLSLPPPVYAQQWLPGGAGQPLVCAYNQTPPTVTTGLFVYSQCNSSGIPLVSISGGSFAVNCGNAAFVGSFGCLVDESTSSQLHADLAAINTSVQNFNDPCAYSKKSVANFFATSGTATVLIPAVASQYVYICGYTITTTAQFHFNLIAGTGSTCATGTPYPLVGSLTVADGLLLGPGVSTAGGIAEGNGAATLAGGSTSTISVISGTPTTYTAQVNYNVCYLFDTTNTPTVSGKVSYVQTAN